MSDVRIRGVGEFMTTIDLNSTYIQHKQRRFPSCLKPDSARTLA